VRNTFTRPDESIFEGQSSDNFELLKAWGGSTLAYAVSITGANNLMSVGFAINLVLAAIICGLAFVLHELAHRVVARYYGAQAHFVANNGWLVLSILIAFAGIFIAAPGAVWHRGLLTKQQGGLIALAGPVTNLVLSVLFFIALAIIVVGSRVAGLSVPGWLSMLCFVGFSFNAWLGLFNMLPAGPFDGAKVLAWNPVVFGVTVGFAVLLAFGLRNETVLNSLYRFALSMF
jgi:Zn-dependent protease